MVSKNALASVPLTLVLLLGVSACTPETANGGTSGSSSGNSSQDAGASTAEQVDSDGFAIPGHVVELKLGDSVTYYSYPELTKDDAQRVTIQSFDYIEKADLPPGDHMDKMENGVLVLSLSWENVLGDVQSNQGYIIATLETGEKGRPTAFMEDRLKNGGVDPGETRSGVFTIDIPRGKTTLTIVDYMDEPVARMVVDTSK